MSNQRERCNVARAVLKAVIALKLRGFSLTETERMVSGWIDIAEAEGGDIADAKLRAASFSEKALVAALTPEIACEHKWAVNGSCATCGVLRCHVDPQGYAKQVEAAEKHREQTRSFLDAQRPAASARLSAEEKVISAYVEKVKKTTPKIPFKRSS